MKIEETKEVELTERESEVYNIGYNDGHLDGWWAGFVWSAGVMIVVVTLIYLLSH